jgi:hypothetical protein
MRPLLFAATGLFALALAGCGGSHHRAVKSAPLRPAERSTLLQSEIRAARRSDAQLFSIFPRRPRAQRCAIPLIEGLRESHLGGTCRTSVPHPVTHGPYAEAFVTFRESWRGRYSSWALIVRLPAGKVVATQLHGEPAPQLRYATDGVASPQA